MAAPSGESASYVPSILTGIDGEPPVYVSTRVAKTSEAARVYAVERGELPADENPDISRVLMRELDPIACKIRGVEDGWWVECTARSKRAESFWRLGS